jgi:exosortase
METPLQLNPEPTATSASATPAPAAPSLPIPWIPLSIVAALIIVAFYPVLRNLVLQWSTDDDMGHGFFVPAVAAYIAWLRKDEILAIKLQRNYLGLLLMAYAAVQYVLGGIAAENFISRTAIVFSIAGAVLFTGGFPLIRILSFPLFLMLFMVPIPSVIYNQITFPLQLFASAVAEKSLLLLGIPVLRDGNILELAEHKLSVVEACSGIRSLLSLTFLSLVYGFFFEPRGWIRAALLFGTIPIAIAANAFRVSMTGVLYEYKPEWAEGFFHTAEGWVIFMIALGLLLGYHRLLNWFVAGVQNARNHAANAVQEGVS